MAFAAVGRVSHSTWTAYAVSDSGGFGLRVGDELDLTATLCHAVWDADTILTIDDTAVDPKYRDHPSVRQFGFRSYVAVPIRLSDGAFFGTLCVLDRLPSRVGTPQVRHTVELCARLIGLHLDATRQADAERQAVEALRIEREQMRTVFEQAPNDAILIMDADRRLTAWNPAAEQITGWRATDAVGQPADIIFTPEDRAAGVPARETEAAARDGKAADERWHVRRDGSRFWGSGTMNALLADDGTVRGFLKIFRDATEKHEQTRTLSFLRHLAEAAVGLDDPDRIIETTLRMLGEHLGVDRALMAEAAADGQTVTLRRVWSVSDMPILASVHRLPDYGDRLLVDYHKNRLHVRRDASAENPPGPELDALRAIGAVAAIDVAVVVDGRLNTLVVVHQKTPRDWTASEIDLMRQVADRLTAEVARADAMVELRRSEQRLRVALAGGGMGVWTLDPASNDADWDPALAALTGLPRPAIRRGAAATFFACIDPADQPHVLADVNRVMLDGGQYRHEFRFRRPDGRVMWLAGYATTVEQSDGRRTVTGINFDVSDRVQARLSLEESQAQLQSALTDREASLKGERAARAEAEQAGRMKDEFLATLSHELRTPLSAILGWSQILGHGDVDPDALAEGLQTIERNARVQSQIIDDLLDMSRIISGKVALAARPIDVGDVVRAAIETVRPTASAKAISVGLAVLPTARLSTTGDFNRLQQVFWNLLTNAIKFTPRGGSITIDVSQQQSVWQIDVRDTGEGMSPQFLPYVFDRFRQADASTTRKHGGLGLGLSIVKHLVELHGGTIRARSDGQGRGSTFTVLLPVRVLHDATGRDSGVTVDAGTPTAAEAEPIRPAAVRKGGWDRTLCDAVRGRRAVIIDDEPDARGLLNRLLSDCGMDVIVTATAGEALAAIERDRPDVFVSDIGMPIVDGYELIRRVRALPPDRGGRTPAIALTAYARAEDRTRAVRAGFQTHVPKPVEATELMTMIASVMR